MLREALDQSRDDWSKCCITDAVTLFVGPEIPKLVRGIIDTDACSRSSRQPTLQRPDNAGGRVGSDVLMGSVFIHLCHCNVSDAQITVRSLDTDGQDYILQDRMLVSLSCQLCDECPFRSSRHTERCWYSCIRSFEEVHCGLFRILCLSLWTVWIIED